MAWNLTVSFAPAASDRELFRDPKYPERRRADIRVLVSRRVSDAGHAWRLAPLRPDGLHVESYILAKRRFAEEARESIEDLLSSLPEASGLVSGIDISGEDDQRAGPPYRIGRTERAVDEAREIEDFMRSQRRKRLPNSGSEDRVDVLCTRCGRKDLAPKDLDTHTSRRMPDGRTLLVGECVECFDRRGGPSDAGERAGWATKMAGRMATNQPALWCDCCKRRRGKLTKHENGDMLCPSCLSDARSDELRYPHLEAATEDLREEHADSWRSRQRRNPSEERVDVLTGTTDSPLRPG